MRYILMTIQGPDHVEAWKNSSGAQKHREMDEVVAWFKEHGAAGRIVGGEGGRPGGRRVAAQRRREAAQRRAEERSRTDRR